MAIRKRSGVIPTCRTAIVVLLYFVVRTFRHRIDTLVSRLMFAQRDRRLRAVRELTTIIDAISDNSEIGPFVIHELLARASINATVVFSDMYDVASAGPATTIDQPGEEVAIRMLVRGRVRGTLFCHLQNGADLAPDEMQALSDLANAMAIDRDDLLATARLAELK